MIDVRTGDCRALLAAMPAGSAQTCVTSPPYFGLRDYGVDGQLGLEATPDAFVAELVDVLRAVRRVLRDDGTLWLNLGDSYANDAKWGGRSSGKHAAALHGQTGIGRTKRKTGFKPGDLVGIPWRVAFALQADGWTLRRDIVWQKPNPMPESVRDRPTTAHEYVFLLSKGPGYFYDAAAIRERTTGNAHRRGSGVNPKAKLAGLGCKQNGSFSAAATDLVEWRNARSVWTIQPRPFRGAHFATMPAELAERCILAGSRPGDLVLDPFGGAGTTGLAAQRHGRRAVLLELNPAYAAMARDRIAADAPEPMRSAA